MKKIIQTLLPVVIFFFVITSCRKDDGKPTGEQKYRLISKEIHFGGSNRIITTEYSYQENRISHREDRDGSYTDITDYSYDDTKVLEESVLYLNLIMKSEDKVEYRFENNQLIGLYRLRKHSEDWDTISKIEFEYAGENLSQFIESYSTRRDTKGVYQYENNRLMRCDIYEYNNGWVELRTLEYLYSGDTLKEFYLTTANVYEDIKTKKVYHYKDGLFSQIDSYVYKNDEWDFDYFTTYGYDENNNAVFEELRRASDSSLSYYVKYLYEKGESNLQSIAYSNSIHVYETKLVYPKP